MPPAPPGNARCLALYTEHFFASATIARLDADARWVAAGELDLFVGITFLVNAHKRPLPFGEHLRARALVRPAPVGTGAAFLPYVPLAEIPAYDEELNDRLQGDIARLEERALRDNSDAFLTALLAFKRYAFALARLAEQRRPVFAAFGRPDFSRVADAGPESGAAFADLAAHLARLGEALSAARDAVNGAFDIDVSHRSHRTNQAIEALTLVSTVLLPATLIVSLSGVNRGASVQGMPIEMPLVRAAARLHHPGEVRRSYRPSIAGTGADNDRG